MQIMLREAQVEEKFNAWLEEKESKIESKISSLENAEQKAIAELDWLDDLGCEARDTSL